MLVHNPRRVEKRHFPAPEFYNLGSEGHMSIIKHRSFEIAHRFTPLSPWLGTKVAFSYSDLFLFS
jgi:hypothetical protein